MHCLDIKGGWGWGCRRAACLTAVYSVFTSAAAEADSSAFLMKLIFEKLDQISRKMDRLEESLQRKGGWYRRRRRRKDVPCHRCQHPGHIARHCRALEPVPTGRRQTSVVTSSAHDGDIRDSAVPPVAGELDKRSNGVNRKSVLFLIDTSSDVAAVSQVSSNKPLDQRRRARRKIA